MFVELCMVNESKIHPMQYIVYDWHDNSSRIYTSQQKLNLNILELLMRQASFVCVGVCEREREKENSHVAG